MKELINNNRIRVGDFITPLTSTDRSSKQKIDKETITLNDTLDQMNFTDIFRIFHPTAAELTLMQVLFECTWNIVQNRSYTRSQIRPQKVQKD